MAQVLTQRGAFIGGAWVAGDGEEIEVRSPYDRRARSAPLREASTAQVDAAVAAAKAAFPAWRRRRCASASSSAGAPTLCVERTRRSRR